jgi:hypothetical protein
MLGSLFGLISEVVQIRKDDASKIMKNVGHGPLECSTGFFEPKGNDAIRKDTPMGCKIGFVLIGWVDLNLIVSEEPIHKRQCLMVSTIIDYLVNERGWEVVFGTSMVEFMKFCADTNSSLFFFNGDGVGDLRSVRNGVNEPDRM